MVRRSHESLGPAGGATRLVGAVLLTTALAFIALKYLGTANTWKLTHWLFSYDLGFVKRGLVGTLVSTLAPGEVVPLSWIVTISLGFAALFLAALAAFAWPAFSSPKHRRALALGLFALASPGFGYLLSDLGRFDVLNYALCLFALVAARAWGRFPYPLFLAIAGLMLLIHEAALLLALPVLGVAYLDANGRLGWLVERERWPALAAQLAPVPVFFALLSLVGGADVSLRELMPRLAERSEFLPSASSAYVLVRGLESNFAQVMGWERNIALEAGRKGPPLGPILVESFFSILPFALAQLAIAHLCLRSLVRERRRAALLALYLCFFAPLPLLVVGVDWGRWVALASAHCATLTLFFAPEPSDEREAPLSRLAALLIAVFVILSAGTSYTMEGARGGSADSPWAGVKRWAQDSRGSRTWDRAFVTP